MLWHHLSPLLLVCLNEHVLTAFRRIILLDWRSGVRESFRSVESWVSGSSTKKHYWMSRLFWSFAVDLLYWGLDCMYKFTSHGCMFSRRQFELATFYLWYAEIRLRLFYRAYYIVAYTEPIHPLIKLNKQQVITWSHLKLNCVTLQLFPGMCGLNQIHEKGDF